MTPWHIDIMNNCDVEDECVMAGCKEMDEEAKTTVDDKTLTHCQITRIIPVPYTKVHFAM